MLDSETPDDVPRRTQKATQKGRERVDLAPVSLLGCSTADGRHPITQDEIRRASSPYIGDFEYMLKVLDTCGVETRHLAMPVDWYLESHDWGERMDVFRDVAEDLLTSAARDALRASSVDPDAVDAVVFVSSTGLSVPSPDAALIERLGFRPDVERTPIVGLGCSGGAVGLARAADIARLSPGRTVLYVGVELCSLHLPSRAARAVDVVSLALFGDGAFALVLRSDEDSGGVDNRASARLLASSETWCVGTSGHAAINGRGDALAADLSADLPVLVETELAKAIEALLKRHGVSPDELAGYVMHVGSKPMLEQMARRLRVGRKGLAHSFDVLREHGNNSSASVMYALERTLDAGEPGLYVLAAPGPGMSMAVSLLDVTP